MKIALEILLFFMAILYGVGIIGEKTLDSKKYCMITFTICVLLIVLIQRVWI